MQKISMTRKYQIMHIVARIGRTLLLSLPVPTRTSEMLVSSQRV